MCDCQRNMTKEYYVSHKYDLEAVLNPLFEYKQKYYVWCTEKSDENYLLTFLLDSVKASFLSPSYNYNKMIDEIVQDIFWDEIRHQISDTQYISMDRRTRQIIVELQNTLISIKIALDRSVKLFRLYKKGIAEYSTFGHINFDTGKAKGFMSQVIQDKENDNIMQYVYDEYNLWIRDSVQPRDAIIHYDDIQVSYTFSKGCEIPNFIFTSKGNVFELCFEDVTFYVNSFYNFSSQIIKMIFDKIVFDSD